MMISFDYESSVIDGHPTNRTGELFAKFGPIVGRVNRPLFELFQALNETFYLHSGFFVARFPL